MKRGTTLQVADGRGRGEAVDAEPERLALLVVEEVVAPGRSGRRLSPCSIRARATSIGSAGPRRRPTRSS